MFSTPFLNILTSHILHHCCLPSCLYTAQGADLGGYGREAGGREADWGVLGVGLFGKSKT